MTASPKAEGRFCWLDHGWGAHSSSEHLLYVGNVLSLLHLTLSLCCAADGSLLLVDIYS